VKRSLKSQIGWSNHAKIGLISGRCILTVTAFRNNVETSIYEQIKCCRFPSHFLKTGLCKYGTTCKYNHPHEKLKQQAVSLNVLGFPMRQDEKSCPFYMRTGTCKYGVDCKFNHPQPSTMGTVYPISDASTYGSTGTPVVAMSNGPAVGGSTWPLSMGVPYISTSDMQNLQAYMPIILSPTLGNMPLQQGWTTYTGSMSLIPSAGVLETTYPPKSKNNPFPSASRIEKLPPSPDQPECQHFMRTGRCKYGSACKYNHPRERNPAVTAILSPLGLPLRPGNPMCSFYKMYGTCKYGTACRYDHPVMSYYNYTMPGVSIPNSMGFFPQHFYPQIPWNLMERTSDNIVITETKDKILPSDGNEFGNRSAESSSPSYTGVSSDSLPSHSD
ncbi:hypothetical protein HPP92_002643, partial [Vanilla planifolia]